MNFVRYTAAVDNSTESGATACQIQYDQPFVDLIQSWADFIKDAPRPNKDSTPLSVFLGVYGYTGSEIKFGYITHDDRQQGELYDMEGGDVVFDGLPDETSFDSNDDIEFNRLEVHEKWLTFIGYNDNGDEISAEILIDDLKPFSSSDYAAALEQDEQRYSDSLKY